MKRQLTYIITVVSVFFSLTASPQQLFLQENIRGGYTGDGVSYYNLDYLQADTVQLLNTIPSSATIKKAYLFSQRFIYQIGLLPNKDNSVEVKFNGYPISIDSSNIASNKFHCDYSTISGDSWIMVNDVTPYVQQGINMLVNPCQACQMIDDTSRHYVIIGYFLLIIYEDNLLPESSVAVWINNRTYDNPMAYNFNCNPVNTGSDIGLSIWANNVRSFTTLYTSDYTLNTSSGNYYLGVLDMYKGTNSSGAHIWSEKLPGSFDYRNNILTGLQDDTPDAFIDSTDALANIKTYLPNNATTFSITTSGNLNPGGVNMRLGFFLAYTTPCPASTSKDTSITICRGQSVQLNSSPGFANYNWYPLAGLTDSTIANPVANPQQSTNYITYVKDAAGCMHTEHTQLIVHGVPSPDSIHVSNAICGTSQGSLLIDPNYHNYQPYTYNIGSGVTTDTTFTNLTTGSYTLNVTDNAGCSYQTTFNVAQTNPVHANFGTLSTPDHTAPLLVAFSNSSSGANTYNWYFPADTLHLLNPTYTFADSGTYVVTLIAYNNLPQCSDTATAIIVVLPKDTSGIFIPNVFSPNGDGVNDVFEVKIKNAELKVFQIFDRWGLAVYNNSDLIPSTGNVLKTANWDGRTTAGEACAAGTYFYVIELENKQGETKNFKGFVTLLR